LLKKKKKTQEAVLPWRYMSRRWAPQTRYTLCRNTAI